MDVNTCTICGEDIHLHFGVDGPNSFAADKDHYFSQVPQETDSEALSNGEGV